MLVLINGRPVSLGEIADQVPAILEAWFPSEKGANAIADMLFGDANPGGKLPIAFPRTVGQVPIFSGHRPSGGRSNWKIDYVETYAQPRYPFVSASAVLASNSTICASNPPRARGQTITVQVV